MKRKILMTTQKMRINLKKFRKLRKRRRVRMQTRLTLARFRSRKTRLRLTREVKRITMSTATQIRERQVCWTTHMKMMNLWCSKSIQSPNRNALEKSFWKRKTLKVLKCFFSSKLRINRLDLRWKEGRKARVWMWYTGYRSLRKILKLLSKISRMLRSLSKFIWIFLSM